MDFVIYYTCVLKFKRPGWYSSFWRLSAVGDTLRFQHGRVWIRGFSTTEILFIKDYKVCLDWKDYLYVRHRSRLYTERPLVKNNNVLIFRLKKKVVYNNLHSILQCVLTQGDLWYFTLRYYIKMYIRK